MCKKGITVLLAHARSLARSGKRQRPVLTASNERTQGSPVGTRYGGHMMSIRLPLSQLFYDQEA